MWHSLRLRRDERGMMLALVGIAFMGVLSVSMLAIDVGMLMTARAQAQNAADAGALAGAVALAFDDFSNRSPSSPAVQSALNAARSNDVMGSQVDITSDDVTFPNDPSGQPNWVRISVFRTAERGNPVATLIASVFGFESFDVGATATAEAAPANAAICVKPWAIPDKWTERQTPVWDVKDTFMAFPKSPSLLPDIFRSASDPAYTGYSSVGNRGLQLTLTPVSSGTIESGMYYALRLPGSSGNDDFRGNISECDSGRLHFGDTLVVEPSATATDTAQAVEDLIAQDPLAYWDITNNRVVTNKNSSPRLVVIPVYDPLYFDEGKKIGDFSQLRVSNFIGFFIEYLQGTDVVGRIARVSGLVDSSSAPAPAGAFPRAIRLVQ